MLAFAQPANTAEYPDLSTTHTGSYVLPACDPPGAPVVYTTSDGVGYCSNQMAILYNQSYWQRDTPDTGMRTDYQNANLMERLGEPEKFYYGDPGDQYADFENLFLYRTKVKGKAPIIIFIHGGSWQGGSALEHLVPAEMFMYAGAHYISLDFVSVYDTVPNGNLMEMAIEIRKAIAWVYKNADSFNGDKDRIFVTGRSSGGHLCGVAMTTDWTLFGLPANTLKGGLCSSGMYDLEPVSLSARAEFVNFTPEVIEELSAIKNLQYLNSPIYIVWASRDTPEFQRQSRDFVLAAQAAGKDVKHAIGWGYQHPEIPETLGNPFGVSGRLALEMMGLEVTIAEKENASFKPDKWTNHKPNNGKNSQASYKPDHGKNNQAAAAVKIGAKILSGFVSLITALFSW